MSVVVYRGVTAGATCVRLANERSLAVVKNSVDRIRQAVQQPGQTGPIELYFRLAPPLFRDAVNLHRLLEAVAALGVAVRAIVPRGDDVLIKVASGAPPARVETVVRDPSPSEAYLISRAVLVTGDEVPVPVSFAVLRNMHEAMRTSVAECGRLLDSGQLNGFRAEFADFSRALRAHGELEDHTVFPYLDTLSGGEITREHLVDEHVSEARLRDAMGATSDLQAVRELFAEWRTAFLHHLQHEEKVMMPWAVKTGTTPHARSVAFAKHILAKRDDDWDFQVAWTVRHLSRFGSQGQPATVATRVWVWGLQRASRRAEWERWLPIVRDNCEPAVFADVVARVAIDTYEGCLPDVTVCHCAACEPVKAIEAPAPLPPPATVVRVTEIAAPPPPQSPPGAACAHCSTTFGPPDDAVHGLAQPCSECKKHAYCRVCVKSLGEHERRLVCLSCVAALQKVIASQQAKECRHCKKAFLASEKSPHSRAHPCSECKLRDACRACTTPVTMESLGETQSRLVCATCLAELKRKAAATRK